MWKRLQVILRPAAGVGARLHSPRAPAVGRPVNPCPPEPKTLSSTSSARLSLPEPQTPRVHVPSTIPLPGACWSFCGNKARCDGTSLFKHSTSGVRKARTRPAPHSPLVGSCSGQAPNSPHEEAGPDHCADSRPPSAETKVQHISFHAHNNPEVGAVPSPAPHF